MKPSEINVARKDVHEMSTVSIIICTRDRCESLRQTLMALQSLQVPSSLQAELFVVDNGSTDQTRAVVASIPAIGEQAAIPVRYVYEQKPGLANARNTGIAASTGEMIVFTDDDVRPAPGWLGAMTAPLLDGTADAVAGSVRLADYLHRPWMSPTHRTWLASTEEMDTNAPASLVGANMAFQRTILRTIPGFDSQLGAGALGFCEEILFSLQLRKAGFRIRAASGAEVEHHCDPDRLTKQNFVKRAIGEGRSMAYIAHHWEHSRVTRPHLRVVTCTLRLLGSRARALFQGGKSRETVPERELKQMVHISFLKHFLAERRKRRAYPRLGFVRSA